MATGSDDLPAWLDRLDDERADIRAALQWATANGRTSEAVSLYESIRDFTRARGRAEERAMTQSLLAGEGLDSAARMGLLHEAAVLAARQGDVASGERLSLETLELARANGDARGTAIAAQLLAMLAGERGDEAAETGYIGQMLEAAGRSREPRVEIVALGHVALRSLRRGDFEEAADQYGKLVERMAVVDVMDESRGVAFLNRGLAELHAGRLGAAADSLAEAARIAGGLRDLDSLGYVLEAHAALAAVRLDLPAAARLQGAASAALAGAGTTLEAFEAEMRTRTMRAARGTLGDEEYERETAAGATLDLDDALALGLRIGSEARRFEGATTSD
jgi:hypothetical protein